MASTILAPYAEALTVSAMMTRRAVEPHIVTSVVVEAVPGAQWMAWSWLTVYVVERFPEHCKGWLKSSALPQASVPWRCLTVVYIESHHLPNKATTPLHGCAS
jgi:hypothetical protein